MGVVYLLSYLYYERAEPRLGERGLKLLRIFLLVALPVSIVGSLVIFIKGLFSRSL